jgi:hypothetical protein
MNVAERLSRVRAYTIVAQLGLIVKKRGEGSTDLGLAGNHEAKGPFCDQPEAGLMHCAVSHHKRRARPRSSSWSPNGESQVA